MAMEGFADLRTPEDLLRKLKLEYKRLQQAPDDVYVAWNFFVTAEHLPDWLSLGEERLPTGESLGKFRANHLETRICSHLATGAKHFQPRDYHK